MAGDSYDVIVIGAGPTGENVADRAVRGGLSAVVVESELVGGECSYWACMPSKALLRPVSVAGEAAAVRGVTGARPHGVRTVCAESGIEPTRSHPGVGGSGRRAGADVHEGAGQQGRGPYAACLDRRLGTTARSRDRPGGDRERVGGRPVA